MRRQHAHLLAGHGNWQLATESASFLFDHVASRSPLPGGASKSRRMPFPDSPVAVDALRSSEARATAGVYGQRLHDGL